MGTRRVLVCVAVLALASSTAVSAYAAPPTVSDRSPGAVVRSVLRPASDAGRTLGFTPTWHPDGRHHAARPWPAAWPQPRLFEPAAIGLLTGKRILLDPGHDLGNFAHVRQTSPSSWPHLRKGCNTTGTATDGGFPEATYTYRVVKVLRRLLVAQGATVVVTRDRNTRTSWGPCVQARGELGREVHADLLLSVHADGAPSRGHGFHVIAPAYAKGFTDDIVRPSRRLARNVVAGMVAAGMARSTYLSPTIQVRGDQETLRNSDVPAVIVETLNMRNRHDARIATSEAGRREVAKGLYAGIVRFLS